MGKAKEVVRRNGTLEERSIRRGTYLYCDSDEFGREANSAMALTVQGNEKKDNGAIKSSRLGRFVIKPTASPGNE